MKENSCILGKLCYNKQKYVLLMQRLKFRRYCHGGDQAVYQAESGKRNRDDF